MYWKISVLPGHRVHRASNMLGGLIRFVSPRIWAAILRTLCDGWTTHRRMQRRAPCLFGCGFGEDSIVHYASCSVLSNLMWCKLKLDRLPVEDQLAGFLLLEPYCKEGREEVAALKFQPLSCGASWELETFNASVRSAWLEGLA